MKWHTRFQLAHMFKIVTTNATYRLRFFFCFCFYRVTTSSHPTLAVDSHIARRRLKTEWNRPPTVLAAKYVVLFHSLDDISRLFGSPKATSKVHSDTFFPTGFFSLLYAIRLLKNRWSHIPLLALFIKKKENYFSHIKIIWGLEKKRMNILDIQRRFIKHFPRNYVSFFLWRTFSVKQFYFLFKWKICSFSSMSFPINWTEFVIKVATTLKNAKHVF